MGDGTAAGRPRPGRSFLRATAGAAALATIAAVAMGWNLQHRMLYFPSELAPAPGFVSANRLGYWPSGPQGYRGLVSSPAPDPCRGTVVVFHGNGGTAADRTYYVEALVPLGFRVLLAEYPRYGGRPGELGEAAYVADGAETVRRALAEFGPPVYLWGESLGAGVACGVARGNRAAVKGLVLATPWDTLASVAREHFPWLPVRLFLRDGYESAANLRAYPGPVAVVAAEEDELVPARHAEALYRALPGPKRLWVLPGVGHNDWLGAVREGWWREVTGWVEGGRGGESS